MEAFVEMRKILISNASLFHRLDKVELKQLESDQKFEEIFKALESDKLHNDKGGRITPKLFNGRYSPQKSSAKISGKELNRTYKTCRTAKFYTKIKKSK